MVFESYRLVFVVLWLLLWLANSASVQAETNVAFSANGAIAIADSQYADFGVEKAIDGEWIAFGDPPQNNRWHSSLSEPHPHWVWIQFKQKALISRVVVRPADPIDVPVDLVGEYKVSGEASMRELFRAHDLKSEPEQYAYEFSFEPVLTNNFRLRIDRSSYNAYPNSAQLSEIEVFGSFQEDDKAQPEGKPSELIPRLAPTGANQLKISKNDSDMDFRSDWIHLTMSLHEARIGYLCWDSLGRGKLDTNLVKPGANGGVQLSLPSSPVLRLNRCSTQGNVLRYEMQWGDFGSVLWETRVEEKGFDMALSWNAPRSAVFNVKPALKFSFAVDQTPVAPFANPQPGNSAPFPCLLHASDFGSLLLEDVGEGNPRVIAESIRHMAQLNLLFTTKKPSDELEELSQSGFCEYRCVVRADTVPLAEFIVADERLAAMPRHWLNVFQYRPDVGILANNVVSDNVLFCMFTFSGLAPFTPVLPGSIEAIELVRESLDRYFNGAPGYGQDADHFADTNPSMLIAAWDVIVTTGDMDLLQRWLPSLEKLASAIEAQDRNGNSLPESKRTGNRGEGLEPHLRTGNWWDCINFGHEDAYVSALAYRAFRGLAHLERLASRTEQAERFDHDADRIQQVYFKTFYNPETGALAGWKSADGELHDYWFTFINGIAITYGLVPEDEAHAIMDRIQAKMKEVGYDRFDLGLPGNLVPVVKNDYVSQGALGSPNEDDGSDTFGVFENGGATACYAYFTIQALYQLGRRDEADRILFPMMETYAKGGFQNGVGKGGEWRRWDGTPSGYEGFLADAFYSQLALITGHYGIILDETGFRLAPWSPLKGQRIPADLKFMGKSVNWIE